jgi:hypothetical protein
MFLFCINIKNKFLKKLLLTEAYFFLFWNILE